MVTAFMNPLNTVALASAALPAAGAYTTDGVAIACDEFDTAVFPFSYTRGAVGGGVKVSADLSFDNGTTWIQVRQLQISAAVPPAEAMNFLVPRADKHLSSGATAETDYFEVDLLLATHIKFKAAEYGVTATPGTLSATVLLGIKS